VGRLGTIFWRTRYVLSIFSYLTFVAFLICSKGIEVHMFIFMFPDHRLLSPQRKTTAKKRGRLNGRLHRGHFMVFSHLKLPTFSMTRIATGSFQRLQNKPRDELKLQGNS